MESKRKKLAVSGPASLSVQRPDSGSSYNVCERVDAIPRVINEDEDYPAFLKACLVVSSDKMVQSRLEMVYTSQQAVETRHKGIAVNETLLKEFGRRIFDLAPNISHFMCKYLLELSLGVEFTSQVLVMIKQFDPVLSEVRKLVHRSGLSREEKVDMCWALVESGFEVVSPLAGHVHEGGGAVAKDGSYVPNGQPKKNGLVTHEGAVLVLDEGEMLSDGELSDEGVLEKEEEEEEEAEENQEQDQEEEEEEEEGSDECVRVMKRRQLNHAVMDEENEEAAVFGVVLEERSDVCDAKKLDIAEEKLLKIKMEAEFAVREKLFGMDISGVYYKVDGAAGERIQVVNLVTNDPFPSDFQWVSERIYSSTFPENRKESELFSACECSGACLSDLNCTCRDENQFQSAPYDLSGRLLWTDNWLIHECSRHCPCGDSCGMRVTQLPSPVKLQLFRTEFKGWGARCANAIAKGTFLGEYLGELIDQAEASKRAEQCDSSYLFDLDWEYINLSGSDVHSEFKPSRDDIITVDAMKFGGVTRFFNHSCSPNLRVMSVANDTPSLKFVHLCFFAARDILPFEELCFNYSYNNSTGEDGEGVKCACGAKGCKGIRF